MIYVDLSVASSPPHLLAALFLARADKEPLAVCIDDLHQLYWQAAGLLSDPGYNEQYFSFGKFFVDHRQEMRAALAANPELNQAGASAGLLEKAIEKGWAVTIPGNWGSAEVFLRQFVDLSPKMRSEFQDWEGTLEEFVWQPQIRDRYDFSRATMLDHFCHGAGSLVAPVADADIELREYLLGLGKADYQADPTAGDWTVTPFVAGSEQEEALKRCTSDLRHGAFVGMEIVLDGVGEHFTRVPSVQGVMQKLASRQMPLIADSSRFSTSLAYPLQRISGETRLEDALEVVSNARTLEMLSELLGIEQREREASTKTYVNNLVEILTPKFARALRETIQFFVRRRRL